MAHLIVSTPSGFNFWRTVYSHGWCTLLPFQVSEEREELLCVLRLSGQIVVPCTVTEVPRAVRIRPHSSNSLSPAARAEIRNQVKACLRLGEDLSEFYRIARRDKKFRWVPRSGAGRLLRSPTVFEDAVKMICTTNCSWALTEAMTKNLVETLGTPAGNGLRAFPTPDQMASEPERFYRKRIRSGYRSPYLREFAQRVASGELDVESWRNPLMPPERLLEEIRSVKGMGAYAAGNLLRLLGRYDSLALDSWVRAKFYQRYHGGRRVSDRTIEKAYRSYGSWQGLFFWLDMTKEWLTEKFPF